MAIHEIQNKRTYARLNEETEWMSEWLTDWLYMKQLLCSTIILILPVRSWMFYLQYYRLSPSSSSSSSSSGIDCNFNFCFTKYYLSNKFIHSICIILQIHSIFIEMCKIVINVKCICIYSNFFSPYDLSVRFIRSVIGNSFLLYLAHTHIRLYLFPYIEGNWMCIYLLRSCWQTL